MKESKTSMFILSLSELKDKACWGFVAGEGTGSVVALDFGNKIERSKEIKNKHLTEEQRKYKSELSFLISCSWRLDSKNKIICSSNDPNNNDGPMLKGLKKIVGKKINSIEYILPAFDLIIYFDNDYCFRVFCDQTNKYDDFDNYSYYTLNTVYTISTKSKLELEPRNV